MRKLLSEQDIKDIKYQCRMGYVIPLFLFLIGTFIAGSVYELEFNTEVSGISITALLINIFSFLLIASFVSYRINRRYYADIKNNEKDVLIKTIQKLEAGKSYEAGSGTMYFGQKMKSSDQFSVIVDNYRYKIDKELFDNCRKGGEILFNYTRESRFLLGLELKRKSKY